MVAKLFLSAFLLGLAFIPARGDELDYNSPDSAEETVIAPRKEPAPSEPEAVPDQARLEDEFRTGSGLVTAGHLMATGGVLLSLYGWFNDRGGNILYQLGVPFVGIGAGQINRAAEKLNPGYRPDYRGWGWYWTAFAMGTFGSIRLNSVLKKAARADSEAERQKELDKTTFPVLLILGSGAAGFVSWGKFGNLASEGKRAATLYASVGAAPFLIQDSGGEMAPGLGLIGRF
jgi:hypothetical protein